MASKLAFIVVSLAGVVHGVRRIPTSSDLEADQHDNMVDSMLERPLDYDEYEYDDYDDYYELHPLYYEDSLAGQSSDTNFVGTTDDSMLQLPYEDEYEYDDYDDYDDYLYEDSLAGQSSDTNVVGTTDDSMLQDPLDYDDYEYDDEYYLYEESLASEALGTSALDTAQKANDNEAALHCDGYCIRCENEGIYVQRSQAAIQKVSKVLYLDPTTATIKGLYHIAREGLSFSVENLPDECPYVNVYNHGEGADSVIDVVEMDSDEEKWGPMLLFKKNINAVYRLEKGCASCVLPDNRLPESMYMEARALCEDRGGFKSIDTVGWYDTATKNLDDRVGYCVNR